MATSVIRSGLLPAAALACLAAAALGCESVTVAGWQLELKDAQDGCLLVYGKAGMKPTELRLAPKPPCRFVGVKNGLPQTAELRVDGMGNATVLAVFGTAYQGRLPGRVARENVYCGTESQGVLLSAAAVRVSPRVARGGLRCEGKEVDLRELSLFAESLRAE